jgi:predicted RNase H-like HicB family nuclease
MLLAYSLLTGQRGSIREPKGANQMSEGKAYDITLRWNAEQWAYLATVDELPGVEGTGRTREEALAAVQDAIRWRLESATEGTRPPPADTEQASR